MMNANLVRFCLFQAQRFSDVANEDDPSHPPIITGPFGDKINSFMDFLYRGIPPFNRSIVKATEYGSRMEDGSFTGCAGSIQRNQSDFLFGQALYPFDDYDNVLPCQVMSDEKVVMLTNYNSSSQLRALDILQEMSAAYKTETFVAIGLSLLLAVFLVGLLLKGYFLIGANHRKPRYKNIDIYFQVYAHFMQQDAELSVTLSWSLQILLLSISVFSFFILVILACAISTNSVVVTKPDVVNTYADFLTRNPPMKPYFFKLTSDYLDFKNAPRNSPSRQIWERLKTPEEVDIVNSNTKRSHIIVKPGTRDVGRLLADMKERRAATFLSSAFVDFVLRTFYNMWLQDSFNHKSPIRTWRAVDSSARAKERGYIIRTDFAKTTIQGRMFVMRTRTLFELGFGEVMRRRFSEGFTNWGTAPHDVLERFLDTKLVVTEVTHDDVSIGIPEFGIVINYCCHLVVFYCLVLLAEGIARFNHL